MSIKEKLRFMAEMERRNNARWKEFAKKEGEKHACVQVLLHEQQPACAAYASLYGGISRLGQSPLSA